MSPPRSFGAKPPQPGSAPLGSSGRLLLRDAEPPKPKLVGLPPGRFGH